MTDTVERELSPEFISAWNARDWITQPESDKEKAWRWWQKARAALPTCAPDGRDESAQMQADIGLLLATIDFLAEATGEGPEGEDAALVEQIRKDHDRRAAMLSASPAPGPAELVEERRAELGIDGNCGFSLLGDDLMTGESEFVEIGSIIGNEPPSAREVRAAKRAHLQLEERLGRRIPFFFGPSHPYGG